MWSDLLLILFFLMACGVTFVLCMALYELFTYLIYGSDG